MSERLPKTTILVGDVRAMLQTLPEQSVHCVVTSPPYWGLRAYGTDPQVWGGDEHCEHEFSLNIHRPAPGGKSAASSGLNGAQTSESYRKRLEQQHQVPATNSQFCSKCSAWRGELGSEPTPELFCRNMVLVFREVWRVLRDDGVLFVNMGDSYANSGMGGNPDDSPFRKQATNAGSLIRGRRPPPGLKAKDLVGVPWQLAFSLRDDGWYLRSEIVWHKPNPMPESVTDRPTKAHEQIFLLTKSGRYFFDQEAVREPQSEGTHERFGSNGCRTESTPKATTPGLGIKNNSSMDAALSVMQLPNGRNLRTVWTIATEPYSEAHFATFPKAIPEKCIKAGTSEKGCCPTCGKPWERVIERTAMVIDRSSRTHELGRTRSSGTMIEPPKSATTGWQAACDCFFGEAVPCTVLDPFCGSGTTLLVAKALGRQGIGTELNPKYAEMAERRIARGYEPPPKQEVLSGQKTMF